MKKSDCGLLTRESVVIPLEGVEVRGALIGRSARVKVKQHFKNNESKAVEAIYKFPLPENSAVCGFRATIGDRVWEGQIEERDKAFDQYDEALARGYGAYLLDEERPNIFTLSLGNLNPNTSAIVEIDYVTLLDTRGQEVRFFLPTTISPRYVPDDMEEEDIPIRDRVNPVYANSVPYGLSVSLDIHGSTGISSIDSPSHSIRTVFCDALVKVEFSAETVAMDRDFLLDITYRDEFRNRSFVYRDQEATYIQLDFSPALQVTAGKRDHDTDVIFVLDCSGSMNGSSIAEAKQALTVLLKGMDSSIHFNIYRFGNRFEKLFQMSKPYTKDHMDRAINYLSEVDADLGGTELLAPLCDIYDAITERPEKRRVVIITDGEIGNEQEVSRLVQDNAETTSVFVVGIGHGPNEYLIKQLARSSGGAAECIAPGDRIEPRVLRLFKKVVSGKINNFTVRWGSEVDQAPFNPVIYDGEAISLFGKTNSDPHILNQVVISGEYMGSKQEWTADVQPVDGTHIPVSLLWAREKIRDLEEGTASTGGSRQLRRKDTKSRNTIIALSKEYGMISRETSFIAVEKRPESQRATGDLVLRKIPVMLTKDWHGGFSTLKYRGHRLQGHVLFDSAVGPYQTGYDAVSPYQLASQLPSVVRPAAPKEPVHDHQHDRLLSILASQRAEGGFELDEDLAHVIGLSYRNLRDCAERIVGQGPMDKWVLLSTIIVLRILEKEFSSIVSVWYDVIKKSRDWYQFQASRVKPSLDGMDLQEWADDYIEKNKA